MADYSIKAVLSAVDNGFSSGINKAIGTLDSLSSKAKSAGSSIDASLSRSAGSAGKFSGTMKNVGESASGGFGKASSSAGSFKSVMQSVGVTAGEGLQKIGSGLNNAGNNIQQFGQKAQTHLSGVGKAMTVAGAATTAVGVAGVKSFGDFQASLNKAAVVAGGTSKDIDGLSDVANRMGAVLPLSAKESADAMVEMAKNGASIKDLKTQFPAIAQAATAAGSDLQATAGTVQVAMNVWGNSLKTPQRAAAYLTQTANLSNASIEEMNNAIGTIGPTSNLAGYSMKDMTTAIGLATNQGMSAANAAQDLNFALLKMMSPTKMSAGAMHTLGISVRDAHGQMKPLPVILGDVAKATEGMSKARRDAVLKDLWGTAGMKVMIPLMETVKNKTNDAKVSWSAYSAQMDKAGGSTARATKFLADQANQMQQNIGSKIEQVGGNWEALRNKAMASKEGVTGSMLDMINSTLEWSTESNSAIARVTRGFIGLTPVIGPAMTGIGTFLTNFSKITGAVGGGIKALGNFASTVGIVTKALSAGEGFAGASKALGDLAKNSNIAKVAQMALSGATKIATLTQTAFNAVMNANPLTLVVVAITAVVTALVLFFTKTKLGQQIWHNFVTFLTNAWNDLTQLAGTVWSGISSTISNAANSVKQGWNGVSSWFGQLWQTIKTNAQTAWQGFATFMSPVVQSIQSLWSGLTAWFGQLWQAIVTVSQGVWQSFIAGMQPIIGAFKNLWSALSEFFTTLWQGIVTITQTIWQGLVAIFTPIVESIKAVWQGITAFFSTLWQGIVSTAGTIWNGLVTVISGVWSTILSTAQSAWQGISGALSSLWRGIISDCQRIWQGLVTIITGVWNNIKAVVQTGVQAVKVVIQTGMQIIKTVWGTVWGVIKTVVNTTWNAIKQIVTTALNAVAGIIRAVTKAIQGDWRGAWNEIKGVARTIWNGLKSTASTVFNGIKTVISTVLKGIESIWKSVWNGIKSFTSTILNGIRSIFSNTANTLKSIASMMMNALNSTIKSGWNGVRSVFDWGKNIILSTMRSIDLFSIGSNIIQGLVNGINSMIGSVSSAIGNIASTVTNGLSGLLKIGSPSRVMRDEIGRWIPAGVAVGIESNLGTVKRAVKDVYNASLIKVPEPQFNNWNASLQRLNSQAKSSIGGIYQQELRINKQPAEIRLSLGGTEFTTFVDDISREQGRDAQFKRSYKF